MISRLILNDFAANQKLLNSHDIISRENVNFCDLNQTPRGLWQALVSGQLLHTIHLAARLLKITGSSVYFICNL